MVGFLAEFTKIADKSEWVQVHFCMMFIDGQLTKRIKTYSKKSIAQREITKWLKRSTNNFCRSYEFGTDKWFTHGTC